MREPVGSGRPDIGTSIQDPLTPHHGPWHSGLRNRIPLGLRPLSLVASVDHGTAQLGRRRDGLAVFPGLPHVELG